MEKSANEERLLQMKAKCDEQPDNAHFWYLLAMEYEKTGSLREGQDALTQAMLNCEDPSFMPVLTKALETIAMKLHSLQDTEEPKGMKVEGSKEMEAIEDDPSAVSAVKDSDAGFNERPSLKVYPGGIDKAKGFEFGRENGGKTGITGAPGKKKVTFQDVGGLEDVKEAISMKIIQPLLHPELFRQFGQQAGGGILLYGPPGCGKTYIAKAAAGECRASFITLHITDVLDQWLGESEKNMESIFAKARTQRPSIVFIDEIDMLGYARTKMRSEGMRGVVDQMLTEMEGVDSNNEGILIIGATNMPWDVDSALRRPGRFDKMVFVPPPDAEARERIFEINLKGRPCGDIDCLKLAECTMLFSGADILSVIEKASEKILKEIISGGSRERLIEEDDLLQVIEKSLPSTVEWLRTISDFVKYANHSGQYNDVEHYLEAHKGYF